MPDESTREYNRVYKAEQRKKSKFRRRERALDRKIKRRLRAPTVQARKDKRMERKRRAKHLRRMGHSFPAIAKMLGVSVPTVRHDVYDLSW